MIADIGGSGIAVANKTVLYWVNYGNSIFFHSLRSSWTGIFPTNSLGIFLFFLASWFLKDIKEYVFVNLDMIKVHKITLKLTTVMSGTNPSDKKGDILPL